MWRVKSSMGWLCYPCLCGFAVFSGHSAEDPLLDIFLIMKIINRDVVIVDKMYVGTK